METKISMLMPRIISLIACGVLLIVLFLYINDININLHRSDLFKKNRISHTIGIKIYTFSGVKNYAIIQGKVHKIRALGKPTSLSHQNSESSLNGYKFLPKSNDYAYQGPQLISPDGEIVIAACVNRNSKPHPADKLLRIEISSKNIFKLKGLDTGDTIEGIAWSPRSDMFAILMSKTRIPFQWNFIRAMAGHPTNSSNYYLIIYNRNGKYLFKDRIISSLVDATVQIVWIE